MTPKKRNLDRFLWLTLMAVILSGAIVLLDAAFGKSGAYPNSAVFLVGLVLIATTTMRLCALCIFQEQGRADHDRD